MTAKVAKTFETIISPTSPENPRNGEGAIISLCDSRLLLGWTHFTGGGRDHSGAEIRGRVSADGGWTWEEPFVLQRNIGRCNVMSVGFARLICGDLLFGFAIKNDSHDDCRYYVRRSRDEGQTWDEPVPVIKQPGYFVVNNDRLLQTQSGRLLVPAAKSVDERYHCVSTVFGSDDSGRTWQQVSPFLDLPDSAVGLQEPGIVECADGSLWMYMRTDRGTIYSSRSTNEGASWTSPQPTSLIAPVSPASAKRLPDSDDILILYNDRRDVPHTLDRNGAFHWRTPLASAVSSDCGQSWQHHRLLESNRQKSYCYTSIAFTKDNTLLSYYVGTAGGPNLLDLKLCIVPTAEWTTDPDS